MKTWVKYTLAFFAGFFIAAMVSTDTSTPSDPVECPQATCEPQVCDGDCTEVADQVRAEGHDNLLELRDFDDEVIDLAVEGFGYCSGMMEGVGNLDPDQIQDNVDKVNNLTPRMLQKAEDRHELLDELGVGYGN